MSIFSSFSIPCQTGLTITHSWDLFSNLFSPIFQFIFSKFSLFWLLLNFFEARSKESIDGAADWFDNSPYFWSSKKNDMIKIWRKQNGELEKINSRKDPMNELIMQKLIHFCSHIVQATSSWLKALKNFLWLEMLRPVFG